MAFLKPSCTVVGIFAVIILSLSGCASFRSEIGGSYPGKAERNLNALPVSVLFIFSHVHQTTGLDAVPKFANQREIIQGFDDIFLDALREFSNVGMYATHTEYASDVNNPERRARRDSLISQYDYNIRIRIKSEQSFARLFLGTVASSLSATFLPISYTNSYSIETELYNQQRQLIATYQRSADLSKWVQMFLIFVYPFHPEERKREEIYLEFLHDTFRQIETEKVLVSNTQK